MSSVCAFSTLIMGSSPSGLRKSHLAWMYVSSGCACLARCVRVSLFGSVPETRRDRALFRKRPSVSFPEKGPLLNQVRASESVSSERL